MKEAIEFELPARDYHVLWRTKRALRNVGGVVLVSVGLVTASVAILVVAVLASGQAAEVLSLATGLTIVAITAVVAIAGPVAGLRLLRAERGLVLFLRRFGHDEASDAVTAAVQGAIGSAWRVVTLDDREIQAIGVGEGALRAVRFRRAAGSVRRAVGAASLWLLSAAEWLSKWIAVPVVLVIVIGAVRWWLAADREEFLTEEGVWYLVAAVAVGGALAVAVLAVVVVVLLGMVAFVGLCILFLPAVLFLGSDAIERADESRLRRVSGARELDAVLASLRAERRRVFGPRLLVLRVSSSIWQETVVQLAEGATVVLIDVSEPTENLIWELETVEDLKRPKVVVGEHRRLAEMMASLRDHAAQPDERQLATLLAGRKVLAYAHGQKSIRQFGPALQGRLLAAAGRPDAHG